ncbi:MAG: FG-GAP repeat domain-containing protein [Candidatus Methylacidiphilales bacterium]
MRFCIALTLRLLFINVHLCTVAQAKSITEVTFESCSEFPTERKPEKIIACDLNGDDKDDLIVAGLGSFESYLSNGDGSFRRVDSLPEMPGKADYAVDDFNGDGKPDVVIAIDGPDKSRKILTYTGNGDGTFSHTAIETAPADSIMSDRKFDSFLQSLCYADLNHDAKLDLIMVRDEGYIYNFSNSAKDSPTQTLKEKNAQSESTYLESSQNSFVLVGGRVFINSIIVMLGKGDGTFLPPIRLPEQMSDRGIVGIQDINRDGHPDIITSGFTLQGKGNGVFDLAKETSNDRKIKLSKGGFNYIHTGDYNNDGIVDYGVWNGKKFNILVGSKPGTFTEYPVAVTSDFQRALAGDFNGDRTLDMATHSVKGGDQDCLLLYLNDGHAIFPATQTVEKRIVEPLHDIWSLLNKKPARDVREALAITGNIDGDDCTDIILCTPQDKRIHALLNTTTKPWHYKLGFRGWLALSTILFSIVGSGVYFLVRNRPSVSGAAPLPLPLPLPLA